MSPAPTSGLSYPLCSWARRPCGRQADASGTSGASEEFSGDGAALFAVARLLVLLTGFSLVGSSGASPDCSASSSGLLPAFFSAFFEVFFPGFLSALSPDFPADFLSVAFLALVLTGLSSTGETWPS